MNESQVVRSKQSCDECGSSDAKAYYDDGHSHCYSCNVTKQNDGESTMSGYVTLTGSGELDRLVAKWSASKGSAIPERNLPSAVVSKYGVVVDGDLHMYPYFNADQTEPVGFKVRNVSTKGFRVVGDIKEAGLFGQHRFGNHERKRVVVVEGELDALAASVMFGDKVPVVSIKGGATAAGKDLKKSYQFIDGFDEVIVCFDADDAGLDAVSKAADVFAGKLRIMKLDPKVGKDACDYLKAGKSEEFNSLYWSASAYTPEGILDSDELWELLQSDDPDPIGDWPWAELNKLTYGFRPTELVTLCAGSGLGKSAVLREVIMHLKQTTEHRIGTLFLEESVARTAQGFMGIDLNTPVHLPTSRVSKDSEEYKNSYDRVLRDGQLVIMNAAFDMGATVEQIIGKVRYLIKAMDCRVIVLDHISILVSAGQHNDERKALDEIMSKLRALSQDTGVVIFAVSHLKRPEGKGHEDGAATSVSQLRGSASIAQLSDFVIGLERNGQADDPTERNTTRIRVLKNRFSGMTGPAGAVLYDPDTGRLHEHTPEDEEAL
jgi:twinkle protein